MWSGSAMPGHSTECSGNSGSSRRGCIRSPESAKASHSGPPSTVPGSGTGSVAAAARGARRVRRAEAAAAATAGDRVRVVHGEARAHQGVEVVDLRAREVLGALLIDVHLDATARDRDVLRG